ncbi:hypothetical protein NPX13_g7984 [Xylaria arbuscula]|uniref:diacylglycerol O-acyltransferase n=1 Tax=Xylaria arbuscula TaxID=114810 RepID=A0A9W8TIR7_9PEZI|nr:hypothetical protein NPX13_g7984 [Xylaria arbuscula]
MAEDKSAAEINQSKAKGSSPRYFYLVSRKSRQQGASNSEAISTGNGEAKRDEGVQKLCQRRGCSSASRESCDTPIPDSSDNPLLAKEVSTGEWNSGPLLTQESVVSLRPKTAGISAQSDSPIPGRPSRIPTASNFKGSLSGHLWTPDKFSQVPTSINVQSPGALDSKGDRPVQLWTQDQASKKSVSTDSCAVSCHITMNDLRDSRQNRLSLYLRKPVQDHYSVDDHHKNEPSLPNGDAEIEAWRKAKPSLPHIRGLPNGHALLNGHGGLDDDRSDTNSDMEDRKDKDDDDASYPELDDMEEIHRPPPPNPSGGIRWAPWNVPFRRRGQTLVVLMHSLSIVATVSLFFAFCANPFAWPLLLLYLLHVLSSKAATDGSLKYRSEWLRRNYIWHFFADYFPARLHKTHELPAMRKYIFGYHPHGIISHGAWAAFATDALGFSEKFPGITNSLLTLDSNFRIPFYREYILSMGVRSVSKESIVNILNKGGVNNEGMGRGVTIVVGGARESLEARPGVMRLILKERKGFIKLAVRCGADIVPVLAFGENNLYDQLQPQEHPFLHSIQMFILKVWKFTLPFLHGRGIFNYDVGLMPYRRPLNIVVGPPIKVKQSGTVNVAEINRLHDRDCEFQQACVTGATLVWDVDYGGANLDKTEQNTLLNLRSA